MVFKQYKKSLILVFLIVFFSAYTIFNKKDYKKENSVIFWDVISYYSYLPATFIYNDLSLEFTEKKPDFWLDKFWYSKTPIKKNIIKTSMGLSFLYSPFFFLAHIYAKNSEYEANGFTIPYKVFLLISILFYYFIGLIYLVLTLKKLFQDKVVAITIGCIGFGTNIYWLSAYSSYPLPHIYNFSLFAIFVYYAINWVDSPKYFNSILLGLVLGLISLIRPTNLLIIIFLFLWGVTSLEDFFTRIKALFNNFLKIFLMIIVCISIWIPQLLYWKQVSGDWFYFSYGKEEGFFFLYPEIINGLFSYRNGLLVYTPILFFAFYGIYIIKYKYKIAFLSILAFTIINIYIILSWWCWWYVGFGNRAFIDSYSIMAIPLGFFIESTFNFSRLKKILVYFIIGILIILNQVQAYQYTKSIIHFDSMNKNAYWAGFMKLTKPDTLKYLLTPPDYEKARHGIDGTLPNIYSKKAANPFTIKFNEINCDCEKRDSLNRYYYAAESNLYKFYCGGKNTSEISYSGENSIKITKENKHGLEIILKRVELNLSLEISVWKYGKSGELFVSTADTNLFSVFVNKSEIINKNGWEMLKLRVKIPEKIQNNDIKVYVCNNENNPVYFDDLKIKYVEN